MATKKQNDDQKRKADSESGSNPDETLSGSVDTFQLLTKGFCQQSIVKVLLVTASLNNDVHLSQWSTEARQQIARDSSISRRIQHATFESDTDGIGDSVEEKPEDD
ncbi:hypothetical protein BD769DRAFT_1386673 [Suillus cothurnatus]|nr:hypothetical protein BD769DRAFT_1386673 [Suillus cothurnatus]